MNKQDEIIKKLDEIHARLDQIEREIKLLQNTQHYRQTPGLLLGMVAPTL